MDNFGRHTESGRQAIHGMHPDRYEFLQNGTGPCVRLSEEEMKDGWHWCGEWDDLLVHYKDEEFKYCTCSHMDKFRNHK